MRPVRTGATLAITVAITYSACALFVAIAPQASIDFLNAFFHVVDFARIAAPDNFHLPSFLMALAVFFIWAFAAGALFGWLFNRLRAGDRTTG